MEDHTYSILRQFADSWFLLAMTLFFIGVVLWTMRPGSRRTHDEIARIPLRHEDAPAEAVDGAPRGMAHEGGPK